MPKKRLHSVDVWADIVRRTDLSKAHNVVAWGLSAYMDNTTLVAWPSIDALAHGEPGLFACPLRRRRGGRTSRRRGLTPQCAFLRTVQKIGLPQIPRTVKVWQVGRPE